MIKNFKPRLYQQTIFSTCVQYNTLVVLPTGLGKTNIFLMLAAHRLNQYPKSQILFLGPTRPLIEQYQKNFITNFEIEPNKLAMITGQITPEKRKELYKNSTVIFSTPQCIENDIITGKIDLKKISLIGFDEAHRAVGDYAYNFIAQKYIENAKYAKIIGMTASPGADKEKINEVIENLYIEKIEVKTEADDDVKPYIQKTKVKYVEVELSEEFKIIKKLFENIIKSRVEILRNFNLIDKRFTVNKRNILGLQKELQGRLSNGKEMEVLKGLSLVAEIMKVIHAQELIESQGASQLLNYLKQMFDSAKSTKTKAVLHLVSDVDFKTAYIKTQNSVDEKIMHPKFKELQKIALHTPNKKKIIFTQFRDSAIAIKETLDNIGVSCEIFVGQAKKNGHGLSQKQQKELIEKFSNNDFEILIATSVAEEGLDIPKVDMVVFFEPIPSAIRQIQRRGRTGRLNEGSAIILVTKNTRDEAYKWSAYHKENRMYKILKGLKVERNKPQEKKITDFDKKKENNDNIKIIVDHREKGNKIVKNLIERGIKIDLEKLDIGDYLLSDRVCIEFKTVNDFVNSIIDGRLINQLKSLKNYDKPLIIIEGTQDIYSQRNINPNAIRGMLTTIMINYRIPIYFTKNNIETSEIMKIIAIKEQINEKRTFSQHHLKPTSIHSLQEYIVASFPGVGSTLSKPLLKKFRSVKNIVNANEKELKEIDLIGEKKAKTIKTTLQSEYKEYDT